MQQHSDLCVVPGTNYTDTNAHVDQKCFEFFRAVLLRFARTPFLALADDDAYLNLPRVASDLRNMRAEARLVYGAVEWYSYDPLTGKNEGYGKGMDEAVNRHPAQKRHYSEHFSSPFPFIKGPLMVFSASVARELVHGEYGRAAQAQSARISAQRVNIDILIGYILSTANGGNGFDNLTWIDLGVSKMSSSKHRHGFLEMRSGRNLTDHEQACYRVVHFGTQKRNKIANTISLHSHEGHTLPSVEGLKQASLITRNMSAAMSNGVEVMREGMRTLADLACTFPPLSFNATQPLASCASFDVIRKFSYSHGPQPQVRQLYGATWRLCEVWLARTRTYQRWRAPPLSKRSKMLRRQREDTRQKRLAKGKG